MTANDSTQATDESVTNDQTADTDTAILHGEGHTTAECGAVDAPGPILETFTETESASIEVTGHTTAVDEHVQMRIGSSERGVNLLQILSPQQARAVGVRLIQAANVADSDPADVDGLSLLDELDTDGV